MDIRNMKSTSQQCSQNYDQDEESVGASQELATEVSKEYVDSTPEAENGNIVEVSCMGKGGPAGNEYSPGLKKKSNARTNVHRRKVTRHRPEHRKAFKEVQITKAKLSKLRMGRYDMSCLQAESNEGMVLYCKEGYSGQASQNEEKGG